MDFWREKFKVYFLKCLNFCAKYRSKTLLASLAML